MEYDNIYARQGRKNSLPEKEKKYLVVITEKRKTDTFEKKEGQQQSR